MLTDVNFFRGRGGEQEEQHNNWKGENKKMSTGTELNMKHWKRIAESGSAPLLLRPKKWTTGQKNKTEIPQRKTGT